MTRRDLIKKSALFGLLGPGLVTELLASGQLLQISACDWSLGKSTDLGAFDVAAKIGLGGIQVNMGSSADDLKLRKPELQRLYLDASKKSGIKISSIAIAELNQVPYKSDPVTEAWVSDSIDVAANLGVSVILLAFFYKGDLRNDEAGKKEVVTRLKKITAKAERLGITLGIESYLSAPELADIIQQVGSRSIKVYYDFRNSADAGYDVIKELKFLKREGICELHIKENGFLLGQGSMDWKAIAQTLRELNYQGDRWMQIEGAMPKGADIIESYKRNLDFLKTTFYA